MDLGGLENQRLHLRGDHDEGRVHREPVLVEGRRVLLELDRQATRRAVETLEHYRVAAPVRFRPLAESTLALVGPTAEQLLENARVANVFVDRMAPWALKKTDPELAGSVLATCAEWISWVARWMAPFMPGKAQALWEMVGKTSDVSAEAWPGVPEAGSWRGLEAGSSLGEVRGLFAKIDDATVTAEIEALEQRAAAVS